jgi:hypothetical protein
MDANDRELILKLLADSREAFCAATAGVSNEQAKIRPAPGRWSVLDCVEHVAFVEDSLFTRITTQLVPVTPSSDRSREAVVLRVAPDRTRKFEAPEQARPKGRFASLEDAFDHFKKSRARTIAHFEQCDLDLRAFTLLHAVVGPTTAQEFAIIIALHPARHAAQIREVREALSIPR